MRLINSISLSKKWAVRTLSTPEVLWVIIIAQFFGLAAAAFAVDMHVRFKHLQSDVIDLQRSKIAILEARVAPISEINKLGLVDVHKTQEPIALKED